MSGEITLDEAVEQIVEGNVKLRAEGLKNLKHVLRYNQGSSKLQQLDDKAVHRMYEVLFNVAIAEKSTWLKATKPTPRSIAATKLSDVASALRLAVEVGTRSLKLKTVRALLDHLTQTLTTPNSGLCSPLALDYAKCLTAVLSYQPHVEHLPHEAWGHIVQFCVDTLKDGANEATGNDTVSGADRLSAVSSINGLSYRSSRSQAQGSSESQDLRNVNKKVSEQIILSLARLVATPNAPMELKAAAILTPLMDYLQDPSLQAATAQETFKTINTVLIWARTEDTGMVRRATSRLLRLAQYYWQPKYGRLRDEVLITLLYLRPYMTSLAQRDEAVTFRTELSAVRDVVRADYCARVEREMLHVDDIRLAISPRSDGGKACVSTSIFKLRSAGPQISGAREKAPNAEHNWALVTILANLSALLSENDRSELKGDHSDNDEEEEVAHRPRKRQRLTNEFEEILSSTTAGPSAARICGLQTVAFLAQLEALTPRQMTRSIDRIQPSCNDDNGTVASWAFLALASCASQACTARSGLSTQWTAVWQLASRSMSETSTCRAACHLLWILSRVNLVSQSNRTELSQVILASMGVSGPSVLGDSVTHLLRSVLRSSQQTNPGAATPLAESILAWLFRHFSPSKFEDKPYAALRNQYEPQDIVEVINACLGHASSSGMAEHLPIWHDIAQACLICQEQEELVSYLLLLPSKKDVLRSELMNGDEPALAAAATGQLTCETMCLNYLLPELQKAREALNLWQKQRLGVSLEMFGSLCDVCCILSSVAHGCSFRDSRRQLQMQKQLDELLTSVDEFASSAECGQEKVDVILGAFSRFFTGLSRGNDVSFTVTEADKLLCRHLAGSLAARRRAQDFAGRGFEDDEMEVDDNYDSQGSRGPQNPNDSSELTRNSAISYSALALRCNTDLYALVVTELEREHHPAEDARESCSTRVVDYISSLPALSIMCCSRATAALPRLGLLLDAADTERMLALWADPAACEEAILSIYPYERSEVAQSAFLDVMSSLMPVWTNRGMKSLFGLGVDMYDFYTRVLKAKGLSPGVQKQFAALLLQLYSIDAEYPLENGIQSVRTSLFKLLKKGAIVAQAYLAKRISAIFGRFVLSTHDQIFNDLQANLPADPDWTEGLAMRLLLLARLASTWHSLLRQCVYYIFEAAGRIKQAASYASRCVGELTAALGFKSAQNLFELFAPQLLHTWLEHQTLAALPYAAFQYASLEELLEQNLVEITAQLLMRGQEDGLDGISSILKRSEKELARLAFAKAVAYTIAWDIARSNSESKLATSETRLRNLIGTKEEYKAFIRRQFPTIMGQFYLSMQQDDVQDSWLEKQPAYATAARALAEVKKNSHSTRPLPATQQPSFKSKHLTIQVERLCRRRDVESSQAWDASSFGLAARMLLDSVVVALGPLHMCLVLRKLRVMVCMAGDVALSGFPLEMLLHSVRPLLSSSECADDALGLLQYLLRRGQPYLMAESLAFTYGTVTIMVLQMQEHSVTRQDSTTQESQHRSMIQTMEKFQVWLVQYLQQCRPNNSSSQSNQQAKLASILKSLRLPGNARKGTPESALLLVLLQQYSSEGVLSDLHTTDALKLLTRSFEAPVSVEEDVAGRDEDSLKYANGVWQFLGHGQPNESFLVWAAGMLGRAYASTGVRLYPKKQLQVDPPDHPAKPYQGAAHSQLRVARRLTDLVLSSSREEAGLADWAFRRAALTFNDADEALRFEQMLPPALVPAIAGGTYDYLPPLSSKPAGERPNQKQLHTMLEVSPDTNDGEWLQRFTVTLCLWAGQVAILPALPDLLRNITGLATELLPPVVHLALLADSAKDRTLRTELSGSITAHLAAHDPLLQSRQRVLLELLLYLRSRPWPGETTRVERSRWLEVDMLLAADTAARCGMPTAALLFAESAAPTPPPNRRVSSRASMSQMQPIEVPDELLLSIFKQVDEPDSFYGVEQPASLDTVASKLEYEGDGFSSLMLRSAQVDSAMRLAHQPSAAEAHGMMRALSILNLNSLQYSLLSGPLSNATNAAADMLRSAQKLQQWDLAPPETAQSETGRCYSAYQELSRALNRGDIAWKICSLLAAHMQPAVSRSTRDAPATAWFNSLVSLTETFEATQVAGEQDLQSLWARLHSRQTWLQSARFEDAQEIASGRSTLFSVLSQNVELAKDMHVNLRASRLVEVKALVEHARLARAHGMLQEALSASTQLSALATSSRELGLSLDAVTQLETAKVLWATGQAPASVKMLRGIVDAADGEQQDIFVGQSGLLAELAHHLAEARLEKPDDIQDSYLKPAIKHLRGRTKGSEAGKVFYEYAEFCDSQLQSPGNLEDFDRISNLRQKKLDELLELEAMKKDMKKPVNDRADATNACKKAKVWYDLDDAEYQRLKKNRDDFTQQSLLNYMLALQASDEHDICVLRFFAMWLENADTAAATAVVGKHLDGVPSWKFTVLLIQLMSRLEHEKTDFQTSLKKLVQRVCADHPHHSLHHLYAATRRPEKKDDLAAYSRFTAAQIIRETLQRDTRIGNVVKNVFRADNEYNTFAREPVETPGVKIAFKDYPPAIRMSQQTQRLQVPPATISLPLRPDGDYSDVPIIERWVPSMSIMSGNSRPKALSALGTDGQEYKQLFKGGTDPRKTDDLRQDAIMEQVFGEVSKMLRNHKAARERSLHVRTYKVIPLTTMSGIMEWVQDSMPIGNYLKPAHQMYYPASIKHGVAFEKIRNVEGEKTEVRIAEFRKICDQMPPVLRHFFSERFQDPDEWFERRTAYTRTTATISILGYVLGLGDRHCQNIMMDEKTGEAVHIDLGIAFEAGRVLPVPELVPFRLSRDIVDGMGITKTEGVFRRCCEFTMDALREDKDSIMTLLNVLRYDPLVQWTVSPLRAKRKQDAQQETGRMGEGEGGEASSKRKEQEAGEADRALSIVEKKLSKTLSTAATVNELIQQATDERNLATLFAGWSAFY